MVPAPTSAQATMARPDTTIVGGGLGSESRFCRTLRVLELVARTTRTDVGSIGDESQVD
jgi:hypothetical protein